MIKYFLIMLTVISLVNHNGAYADDKIDISDPEHYGNPMNPISPLSPVSPTNPNSPVYYPEKNSKSGKYKNAEKQISLSPSETTELVMIVGGSFIMSIVALGLVGWYFSRRDKKQD